MAIRLSSVEHLECDYVFLVTFHQRRKLVEQLASVRGIRRRPICALESPSLNVFFTAFLNLDNFFAGSWVFNGECISANGFSELVVDEDSRRNRDITLRL